ncbi:hypothetical protein KRR39_09670 [Nocardioides panacis]|uniref:Uncharacterized protein n=1 Tax=Nocardioides panacis TaxID=2849501 RepID=A0A975Y1X7_9ACTN|nr:rhomboid-like protein [Nocardioides panacis]QWZ09965.1 hypothetical protein KRR39_09670 [Nocardioides panacis]
MGGFVGSAPLTFTCTTVLLATTTALRWAPPPVQSRLLTASSTDVAHLGEDPLTVLVLSAVWLPGRSWLPYAVVLLMVVAPLERRIGTLRTAAVFWSAHVLATLLTELPTAAAISLGWMPPAAAHRLDVGASYGTLALAAAFVGSLPLLRGLAVLALAAVLVAGVPDQAPDLTMYGHALSLLIGVCWWPALHDRWAWRRRLPPDRRAAGRRSRRGQPDLDDRGIPVGDDLDRAPEAGGDPP